MRILTACAFSLSLIAATAPAEEHPGAKAAPKDTKGETLDQILQEAARAGERPGEREHEEASAQRPPSNPQPTEAKPPEKSAAPAASPPDKKPPAPTPATPGATATPPAPAPVTDDNDATAEAAPPKPFAAAAAPTRPRKAGPYDMGPLDCRVLDGAGIERVLPPRLIAGEEPDLLCRIIVTQPPTVATATHQLTFTVQMGEEETYRQVRNVRVSSIGRRALVFVVPADRIATEDSAQVRIRATLSSPATPPGGRTIKFTVETED